MHVSILPKHISWVFLVPHSCQNRLKRRCDAHRVEPISVIVHQLLHVVNNLRLDGTTLTLWQSQAHSHLDSIHALGSCTQSWPKISSEAQWHPGSCRTPCVSCSRQCWACATCSSRTMWPTAQLSRRGASLKVWQIPQVVWLCLLASYDSSPVPSVSPAQFHIERWASWVVCRCVTDAFF